jgi:hypothetical protein
MRGRLLSSLAGARPHKPHELATRLPYLACQLGWIEHQQEVWAWVFPVEVVACVPCQRTAARARRCGTAPALGSSSGQRSEGPSYLCLAGS